MQDLFLIRGLPGSGKSTLAKKISDRIPCASIIEADMFFMVNGEYRFDPSRRAQAHAWCRQKVYDTLMFGVSVIVANTFCSYYEMAPYIEMAHELGVRLTVIECRGDYGSVHNVPPEVIETMKARWESYDSAAFYLLAQEVRG